MDYEARIIQLESTVAFQENLVEKLDATINEQQLQLHRLEEELERIRSHLQRMDPSMIRDADDETPPPHY